MTNFSTPLPQYAPVHVLEDSPPFPQLRTYLKDGLFFSQKTNKNIRISYSLKYKHSKRKILYEIINGSVYINIKNKWSSINQKLSSTMSVMLCTRDTSVTKNPCIVATIVSFDTVGLQLLTFHILEPYLPKDILTLMALLQYSLSLFLSFPATKR